jgi:importin subunit beta-1
MQVVCEATTNEKDDLVVSAYQCLVRIMSLYYDQMGYYMEQALYLVIVILF